MGTQRQRDHVTPIRETRTVALDSVQVQASPEGDEIRVDGHAAVWDTPAWIGPAKYGFSERFAKGAFSKTISDGADVRYLFNHDPNKILARTKNGTLTLGTDATGLTVDAKLAPTTTGRDLAILMNRGDVNQMSVGMQVIQDRWEEVRGADGVPYEQRTITEAKLFDVSAVTYPAYEETDAGVREAELARESRDARGQYVKRISMNTDEAREQAVEPETTTPPSAEEVPGAGEPPTSTPETTATNEHDERSLPLSAVLIRHMDGEHLLAPRALCPVCAKAEPPTGTPLGTPDND